ncbi:MAG: hypothetical protein R3B72_16850 [Polyangiaceae bacterium]
MAALAVGAVVGCAAGGTGPDPSSGSGGTGGFASSTGGSLLVGGGGGVTVGAGGGTGGTEVTEVFGHSGTTLYRLDPITNAISTVGDFQNCGPNAVLDIALDKNSNLYAVKRTQLYRVDRQTAVCTLVNELTDPNLEYPNSLSFVPEGTLESNEALVGYQDADYVKVDTTTGALSVVAAGALGGTYISSGDIVSIIDGATYLTIKGGDCDVLDCIVEVNPVNGSMVKNYGSVGFDDVFGLAFWGGKAYGFTRGGELFEMTFGTNNVASTLIPFPNAPAGLQLYGAGSATSVPFEPPQ